MFCVDGINEMVQNRLHVRNIMETDLDQDNTVGDYRGGDDAFDDVITVKSCTYRTSNAAT